MYRSVFTPKNESELFIKLPSHYLEKEVEVIAFEIDSKKPSHEIVENREEKVKRILNSIEHLRTSTIDYKFDRDEANER